MTQGDLFSTGPGGEEINRSRSPWAPRKGRVRRGAPDTSHAAAALVAPRTGSQRYRIAAAIAEQPRTCDQIQEDLGIRPQSASARINELVADGLVEDTHDRRLTSGQVYARVLAITDLGRAWLQKGKP